MSSKSEIDKNTDIMINHIKMLSKFENMKYFVEHGELFIGREPSKNIIKSKVFKPELKGCYSNSQVLALTIDDLRYYEGYVVDDSGFPFDHAWNVTGDRKVIDTTLNILNEEYRKNTIYFGVEIPKDFISEMVDKSRTGGYLLHEYIKDIKKKGLK